MVEFGTRREAESVHLKELAKKEEKSFTDQGAEHSSLLSVCILDLETPLVVA